MIAQYVAWHYGRGLKAALGLAENAVEAALHIWSVRELFATFFSPWRMVVVPHRREEALSTFLTAVWYNLLSRMIGAVVRSIAIVFGLSTAIAMGGIGAFIVVFWVVGPFWMPIFLIAALTFF